MEMRAGISTALSQVVAVCGVAHPHHAYVNRRVDRFKVLVHDGIGKLVCARRPRQGGFVRFAYEQALDQVQFDSSVLGLP